MIFIYFFFIFLALAQINFYVVWIIIEIIFIFFLLLAIGYEEKNLGLVVYFFFQSLISLLLFLGFCFFIDKIVFMFLIAKLGIFPFFYWIILVRVKVGFLANIFVLSLQKIVVFWLFWLTCRFSFVFLILFVYGSLFFAVVSLIMVSDLWLLLVYSSIANTAIILIRVISSHYLVAVFLYIRIVFLMIMLLKYSSSLIEVLFLIFFFLVIPPFVLFFLKISIVVRLEFFLKLGFYFFIFDVFVLIYYFSLIFLKFILLEISSLLYFMNFIIIFFILILRNCVTLVVFY